MRRYKVDPDKEVTWFIYLNMIDDLIKSILVNLTLLPMKIVTILTCQNSNHLMKIR